MKLAPRLAAVAAAAAAAAAPAAAHAAPARDAMPVVVTNDASNPVVTTLVGTPTVQGTVGIDPAQNTVQVSNLPAPPSTPAPYQTRLDVADTGDALFQCVAVPRPPSGTLKITDVALDVRSPSTTAADEVVASLRNGASDTTLAVAHPIPLSGDGIARRGHLATNYYVGPVSEPSATNWRLDVCVANLEPAGITSFKALVTGEVL